MILFGICNTQKPTNYFSYGEPRESNSEQAGHGSQLAKPDDLGGLVPLDGS